MRVVGAAAAAVAATVSRGARGQWKTIAAAVTERGLRAGGISRRLDSLVEERFLCTTQIRSFTDSPLFGSVSARSLASEKSTPSWIPDGGEGGALSGGGMEDAGGSSSSHSEGEAGDSGDESEGDGGVTERPLTPLEMMLRNAPRRSQKFIMQKALKIKSEGEDGERAFRQGFEMKVIDVNRTVKVTKGGKVQSFTALVITGNYNGVVGFGKGKSSEVGLAVDRASLKALNNLHFFERFEGHTIFHEHDSKFEKTKVYLWPARSGTGMRASATVGGILRLAGYKNVKSKVVGSRHPLNTVKAVFQTLSEIESPEEVAERRSRAVVESHLVADSL